MEVFLTIVFWWMAAGLGINVVSLIDLAFALYITKTKREISSRIREMAVSRLEEQMPWWTPLHRLLFWPLHLFWMWRNSTAGWRLAREEGRRQREGRKALPVSWSALKRQGAFQYRAGNSSPISIRFESDGDTVVIVQERLYPGEGEVNEEIIVLSRSLGEAAFVLGVLSSVKEVESFEDMDFFQKSWQGFVPDEELSFVPQEASDDEEPQAAETSQKP